MILVGWDRRTSGRRGYLLKLQIVGALFILATCWDQYHQGKTNPSIFTIVVWTGIGSTAFVQLLSRWSSHRVGFTQLRLWPNGITQIGDLSSSDGNSWSKLIRLLDTLTFVGAVLSGTYELSKRTDTPWLGWGIGTVVLILVLVGYMVYRIRLQRLLSVVTRFWCQVPLVHIWNEVAGCDVLPIDTDWRRIRITDRDFKIFMIDTDVNCTVDQAAQIRFMTRQWILNSRRPSGKSGSLNPLA